MTLSVIAGCPSRAAALQSFLDYANSLPDVWFARRIDIARWWLNTYPLASEQPV